MNPEHQLTHDNNYTPSPRAAKAASSAKNYSGPVKTDGPTSDKGVNPSNSNSPKSDMPKQNAGGAPPSLKEQSGSAELGDAKSINERKA